MDENCGVKPQSKNQGVSTKCETHLRHPRSPFFVPPSSKAFETWDMKTYFLTAVRYSVEGCFFVEEMLHFLQRDNEIRYEIPSSPAAKRQLLGLLRSASLAYANFDCASLRSG